MTTLSRLEKISKKLIFPHDEKASLKKDFLTRLSEEEFSKEQCTEFLGKGIQLLSDLQDKLYAQRRHSVLVIFQAMDAAGKDSTIKHVMSGVNPQGCQVTSFKTPSYEELSHDYMWRCLKVLPAAGNIGIFNRSYYEEVLATRIHPEYLANQNLPPDLTGKDIWKHRFEDINNIEKYLTRNGTVILKFFLNVSKEEQKKRFLKRIKKEEKNWKFAASDAVDRKHWDSYMAAYQDCFQHTSTKWAPWHIIPADDKPFMRLIVGYIIMRALQELDPQYPVLNSAQREELLKAEAILNKEDS